MDNNHSKLFVTLWTRRRSLCVPQTFYPQWGATSNGSEGRKGVGEEEPTYSRKDEREREEIRGGLVLKETEGRDGRREDGKGKGKGKGKGSLCSIAERRVPQLIPVLGSQPAGNVDHKPGSRLPLLSARPTVTLATLKRAATNFAAW